MDNIRNFVIIAHIDHGKSTLADRFLELTGTVEKRNMREQYLDGMELERERGVTIKMAPVRMSYILNSKSLILNLIDTPGHSDFSYEVSRALAAVEGAILLVDATQGIQAQTLANLQLAKRAGLKIIGAVNKVDLLEESDPENSRLRLKKVIGDLGGILNAAPEEILLVSGKTGFNVDRLLSVIVEKIPPPKRADGSSDNLQALVFDSFYDEHRGVVASVRVFGGELKIGQEVELLSGGTKFKIKELGIFTPSLKSAEKLSSGEIGYIATGLKDPDKLKIGDTVGPPGSVKILTGYQEPQPVVFVSFYPEQGEAYDELKQAFQKLRLNDSSLKLEPDYNEVLGRGFKVGFLGRFHLEIAAERLHREFKIETIQSFPSVAYQVKQNNNFIVVTNPQQLPKEFESILEPLIKIEILSPLEYLGKILQLKEFFRIFDLTAKNFGERLIIEITMPLADFLLDFDDKLKSVSEGFASFSYEPAGYKENDLTKIDILVAGEIAPGLTRIVPKEKAEAVGRQIIEKLKDILPRQQFVQALQASANGRIVARENIPAVKKDVTGHLYGGDRTRKMKLWKKQQKGKKRLKEIGRVSIPAEIYRKLLV